VEDKLKQIEKNFCQKNGLKTAQKQHKNGAKTAV